MFLFWCVIFFCSVLIQDNHGFESRIAEGFSTTIENHPHQVYFGFWVDQLPGGCGGSIVSPRHVLTAAHCVVGLNSYFHYVRAGSTRFDAGGTVYAVTKMGAHPRFDLRSKDYDVALLVLDRQIYLDGRTTKIIALPPPFGASVQPGMNVVITGWGRTSLHGPHSQELMEVTVPTISREKCQQMSLTPRMFCAGSLYAGACKGDSGGPVVDKSTGVQIGVVSHGLEDCTTPQHPGVYSDLTNHEIRQWIQQTIGV